MRFLTSHPIWVPSLRSTNLSVFPRPWIDPETVLIYYRNAGVDPDTVNPFDQRFSYRAGDPTATLTDQQGPREMDWSCVANQIEGAGPNEVEFGQTIPESCPVWHGDASDPDNRSPYMVRLVVYFPNCVKDHTIENGQWKPTAPEYAVNIPNPDPETPEITKYCATTGYEPIPQVQIGFRWPLDLDSGITKVQNDSTRWDLTSLRLSSDDPLADQDDGVTGHIDFMSGWSTNQLADLMATCYTDESLGAPRNCGAVHAAPYYDQN